MPKESLKKRSLLRYHYRAAVAASDTLLETLQAAHSALVELSTTGRITTGVSGGGISKSFATDRDYSPASLEAMHSELLDLYDTASAALVSGGTASPSDAQIYGEMMWRLEPVLEVESDYTSLRLMA